MTKPTNAKARRKRRLARYWASDTFRSYEFAPTGGHWRQMEEALGRSLSDNDRTIIRRVCLQYFENAEIEQNAPFVYDVQSCWDSIIDATAKLGSLLVNPPGDSVQQEAAWSAQAAAFSNIRMSTDGMHTRENLLANWEAFVNFAVETNKDIREKAETGWGFIEGEGWKTMICQLWKYGKRCGWKPSASKGQNKSGHASRSRFVAFIAVLQTTFPEEYSRHSHSSEGLAKAISAARHKLEDQTDWELPSWITASGFRG